MTGALEGEGDWGGCGGKRERVTNPPSIDLIITQFSNPYLFSFPNFLSLPPLTHPCSILLPPIFPQFSPSIFSTIKIFLIQRPQKVLDTKGTGMEGKWEDHGIIRNSMIMIFYGEENPNHYLLYGAPYGTPTAVAHYICSSRLPTLVDVYSSMYQ